MDKTANLFNVLGATVVIAIRGYTKLGKTSLAKSTCGRHAKLTDREPQICKENCDQMIENYSNKITPERTQHLLE